MTMTSRRRASRVVGALMLAAAGACRAQAPPGSAGAAYARSTPATPAAGPFAQLLKARRLLSPPCVGCVTQCATATASETFSQPAMRAVGMFAFRHLFWNEAKECAEFGEGLALVFRNLRLWHLAAVFANFYSQCVDACYRQCPYWGVRAKRAARLLAAEEQSHDWAYKIGPSYAWEERFAEQKLGEVRSRAHA